MDVREYLPLVVGRTAGEEIPVAPRRLERWASPQFQRVRRLHVVMSINQDGRRPGDVGRLGIDQGMTTRADNLGRQAHPPELRIHPLGRFLDIGLVDWIGAYAGNSQKITQFGLKLDRVGRQILIERRHA